MITKKAVVCVATATCVLLLAGCQPLREVRTESLQASVQQATAGRIAPGLQQIENQLHGHVTVFDEQQSAMQRRITYIEDELLLISGVDTVNVVIIENAAIVSVGLADNVSKAGITYLRDAISQQTKRLDPDIRYVTVTVSPELAERLNELSEDVVDGLPQGENRREVISNLRPVI